MVEPAVEEKKEEDDDDDDAEEDEKEETCGFCIFMKGGPCKEPFVVRWTPPKSSIPCSKLVNKIFSLEHGYVL